MPEEAVQSRAESTVRAAEALARAWEVVRLYGGAHAASAKRLSEFADATSHLPGSARFTPTSQGLLLDGAILEPRHLYAGFAHALRSTGIGLLEITRPLNGRTALALITVLSEFARAGCSGERPADRIKVATGNAVRVRCVRAGEVADLLGEEGQADEGVCSTHLHDLLQVELAASLSRDAKALIELLEQRSGDDRSGAGDGAALGAEAPAATKRASSSNEDKAARLHAAISNLSEADQRQIVQVISRSGLGSFDDALTILSRVPVHRLADAVAVLARSDGKLSGTSMMLVGHLANLAVGSPTELRRLSEVADRWSHGDHAHQDADSAELAARAAMLLRRAAETEFRSEQYSALIKEFMSFQELSNRELANRLHDERGLLTRRAAEIVCDTFGEAREPGCDRSATLAFLESRCRALAEHGAIDALSRVLKLAADVDRAPASASERTEARRILAAASKERWPAVAVSRCTSAASVLEYLDSDDHGEGEESLTVLLWAAAYARSPAEQRAIVGAARRFDLEDVLARIDSLTGTDIGLRIDLCRFVHDLSPDRLLAHMRPALLHRDPAARAGAFRELARTGIDWPRDLCIRGLVEETESARIAAAEQIAAAHPGDAGLLIQRLVGRIGRARVTAAERSRIWRLLAADASKAMTRMLAWSAVWYSWRPGTAAQVPHLWSLLGVRPRSRFVRLLTTFGRLSPVRFFVRRKDAA